MPIQLLLDWSKALVAIVCSLLLALSFIMCNVKPLAINNEMTVNRTQALTQDVIESENHFGLWNASLNRTSFGLNAMQMKNISNEMGDPTKTNVTQLEKFEENKRNQNRTTHNLVSTSHAMISTDTNDSPQSTNKLILATLKASPEQNRFQMHRSLASRMMNKKDDEEFDKLSTSTKSSLDLPLNLEQKLQSTDSPIHSTTTITANIKQQLTTTELTTKSYSQSVFLDYSSKHIVKLNRSSDRSLQPSQDSILKIEQVDDEIILSRTDRSVHISLNKRKKLIQNDTENLERIERSANLSLAKATKRIQLLIKSRFLQLLPDGTVNGTQDEDSEYTILQRNTVDVGQIRLIGIATCLYLCMDSCGNLYTSREFTNDCIFNERLEDNYNYYTSTHHSTALRTYYVALNRLGAPRKTYLPSNKPLAKLSTYAKAFTFIVPEHRSENVIGKRFGFNHVKHGIKHLCESGKELMILSEKQIFVPECIVGSASNDNFNIANSSSSLSKKQTHHMRHVNTNNNHRSPSAPLIDRSTNNKNNILNPAPTKAAICNQEPCPKKKKSHNNGGNRNGGHNKKDNKKINQKNVKTKTNRRAHSTRAIIVTTENIIRSQETQIFSDAEIENIDEESIDSFVPVPIAINGNAAITNDEDYDNDK